MISNFNSERTYKMIDRCKYLNLDEVRALKTITKTASKHDTTDGRDRGSLAWMVVDLALSTGLRVSELCAIKKEDVFFKRHLIRIIRMKRRKPTVESLAISPKLQKHLKHYIRKSGAKTGFLFHGQRGPLTPAGLQQVWRGAIKRAGLPKELSIHSARHTMAFHLLKKTGNLRQVQKQLGHTTPTTTANMYCDVDFDEMLDGVTDLYR